MIAGGLCQPSLVLVDARRANGPKSLDSGHLLKSLLNQPTFFIVLWTHLSHSIFHLTHSLQDAESTAFLALKGWASATMLIAGTHVCCRHLGTKQQANTFRFSVHLLEFELRISISSTV